ncbi:MAG TPA: hypothetical protein GXX67_13115 [Petrimonas sp.]|jgi:hypothetical protein|nr:hypothetical protein [Petrimonas sp.]
MNKTISIIFISLFCFIPRIINDLYSQLPITPSIEELKLPFNRTDILKFQNPSKVFYPEIWFHFYGGNISALGIKADIEAIANAGFSGLQLFHEQHEGSKPWPGVSPQIIPLGKEWEDLVKLVAEECKDLGLRFTMHNALGWGTSGGPWIETSNSMRHLVYSRLDTEGGRLFNQIIPMPQPSHEEWRDYHDVTVLAFPTPIGDSGESLRPYSAYSNVSFPWESFLSGEITNDINLTPTSLSNPHWIEVGFTESVVVRTIEFSDVQGFNHQMSYEPSIYVKVYAIFDDGTKKVILDTPMPQAAWQSNQPISLSCNETGGTKKYRIEIVNEHDMNLKSLRLSSAARKNNWESEAAWTLRSIVRASEEPKQSPESFIHSNQILDISEFMDELGNLKWNIPQGKWTILRVGHVNTGQTNAPAPIEGVGWECDKFSKLGAQSQFANYIGQLNEGILKGGLLNGMLIDSWECSAQTWTSNMEIEFHNQTNYHLRKWLPAIFGYVIDSQETTSRFLRDWRSVVNYLVVNNFYGEMAQLAKKSNLNIAYETAAGDVLTGDIMEYFKHADVPMCEFWQPYTDYFVGSFNFKPIKPTVSAGRLYGKPRISAEAFTSFELTWDEHLKMLKEVANLNFIEGVTHLVYQAYTHNPRIDGLPPGCSFGDARVGTPFLRHQTWWKFMPEFNLYMARVSYLLERGNSVSDILWYLGDEINHKPDQKACFPSGFKYDYCNPDILLNRLTVKNGKIVTPEGLSYYFIWLPDNKRMLPETLEKLLELVRKGAIIVGDPPQGLATLKGKDAQQRFDKAVKALWGDKNEYIRAVGNGKVLSNTTIDDAIKCLALLPDVINNDILWLHREVQGADWYYICPQFGSSFEGNVGFKSLGTPQIWDPLNGEIKAAKVVKTDDDYTYVNIDLPPSGSCFVVFPKINGLGIEQTQFPKEIIETTDIPGPWKLSFPSGWGAPESHHIDKLTPWKDLELSSEAKTFSGSVIYSTTFQIDELNDNAFYSLDLGRVEDFAVIKLNGKVVEKLWTPPYCSDITENLKSGENILEIEVTSTWFNRLLYDANQPVEKRKTWVISWPNINESLKEKGLLGPVIINKKI